MKTLQADAQVARTAAATPVGAAADRVARALLEGGPQSAAALSTRLGLTGTAIRRHLDTLLTAGQVEAGERAQYGPAAGATGHRGRGRPARIYSLTAIGRGTFDQSYDDLALAALQFLATTGGSSAVAGFARHRAADLERRYAHVAEAEDRPAALVAALTIDGYAAEVVATGTNIQICQHHCPVGHVAEQFPELCEAEGEAFSRLLGTHVTRLATLAHGDGICTTLVPTVRPTASTPSAPRKDI